jgi:hypothetical protein
LKEATKAHLRMLRISAIARYAVLDVIRSSITCSETTI